MNPRLDMSFTSGPDGWNRSTCFSKSNRFGDPATHYPGIGDYDPPPSSLLQPNPSKTRLSNLCRRGRDTAPKTGSSAMASLNGIDTLMPDPGPDCGSYEVNVSSFDNALRNSGSASSIFKSNRGRFLPTREADATETRVCPPPLDPSLTRPRKKKGRNLPKVQYPLLKNSNSANRLKSKNQQSDSVSGDTSIMSERPWTVADPNSTSSMYGRRKLPQLQRSPTFEQKIKDEIPWRLKKKEMLMLDREREDVRQLDTFVPPQTRNIRFY